MLKNIYGGLQDGNLTTNLVDNLLWKENEKMYVKKDAPQDMDMLLESFRNWYLNSSGKFRIEDPTFLSFRIIIDWNSPLFRENDKRVNVREQKILGSGESLSFYLDSINQEWRKDKILSFRRKFQELMNHRFHYLKSMEGLGNHWKFSPKTSFHEQELTIHTIESLDMFISSMADDYLQATYDLQNMKNVAPINLRYFDMIVVVHEIRNIKSMMSRYDDSRNTNRKIVEEHGGDPDRAVIDKDGMVFLNPYIGTHAYRFQDCLFDFSETMSYLSNISNEGGKEVSSKFKIKLGRIDFRYHDLDLFSTSPRKQRFLQEVEPFVYPSTQSQLQTSREVRRFTREPEEPKTKWQKFKELATKMAMNEAKKASKAVTRAVDDQLQKTTQHVTRSMKSKLDKLDANFRPSNFIGKHANRITSRLGGHARGLVDKADGVVDGVLDDMIHFINGTHPEEEQGRMIIKHYNEGKQNSEVVIKDELRTMSEDPQYEFPDVEDTTREQLREIITENRTMFEYYKSIFEESMSQNSNGNKPL